MKEIIPAPAHRRLEELRAFIERHVPAHAPSERYLQERIEEMLRPRMSSAYHRAMRREYPLSPQDRIDFLVQENTDADPHRGDRPFGIGIEVKVDGTLSELVRQLQRYAQHDLVDALLVVSTRARHHDVPASLSGKPVALALLLHGGL